MTVKIILNKILSVGSRKISFAIFLTSIIAQAIYLRLFGIHLGGDSQFYLDGASMLIDSHFNFLHLSSNGYPAYYFAYPTIIAALGNPFTVICFQIILQAVASVLLFLLASQIFDKITGIAAGFIFALSFEIFQWNTYILTDSIFVSLLVIAAYFHMLAIQRKRLSLWASFIGITSMLLFLRPTTIPFIGAIIMAATWNLQKAQKAVLYCTGILIIVFIVFHSLSQDAGLRLGINGYIHYFASLFDNGTIVRDRASLSINPHWDSGFSTWNIAVFGEMVSLRLIAFWMPFIQEFSTAHKILNVFTLIPIFIFGTLGISYSLNGPRTASQSRNIIFFLSIILTFWIFQSFTEIDYDWRYRLPVLPFLIAFAAFGLTSSLTRYASLMGKTISSQVIRFLFFGSVNTVVDYAVLNTLYIVIGFSLFWSVFFGFVAGGVTGYFFHSRFTFRYDTTGVELQKLTHYLFISVINLSMTEILMYFLTTNLGIYYNMSKLITLILSIAISFSTSKFWVFRKIKITDK